MSSDEPRYGDWIQTWTGKKFYVLDPRPEDIDIQDIAHALSQVMRFGGHASHPYSVAQHSVHVSQLLPPELALYGLLHDAAKAYIGDMVRPLKRMPEMEPYRNAELRIWGCIAARFDLLKVSDPHDLVKRADNLMLATERRDLFRDVLPWGGLPEPAERMVVRPWSARVALDVFLNRYDELTRSQDNAALIRGLIDAV